MERILTTVEINADIVKRINLTFKCHAILDKDSILFVKEEGGFEDIIISHSYLKLQYEGKKSFERFDGVMEILRERFDGRN